MERILADLAARYPEGYYCFSYGGKRLAEPRLYQRKTGYSVSVNGIWHFYSRLGEFMSAGHSTSWLGKPMSRRKRLPAPRPPPRPPARQPVSNYKQAHLSREAARLARGIARIEGRHAN